jgi:hypothetical protein
MTELFRPPLREAQTLKLKVIIQRKVAKCPGETTCVRDGNSSSRIEEGSTSKVKDCAVTISDNSVGIETGYWVDGRVSISVKGKFFSLLHSVQNASGAHSASIQ